MPLLTITWHTHIDERTCKVCAPLHGHQWSFDTEKDRFPDTLIHSVEGEVWNCRADEPLTHGIGSRRGPWNCRCMLTWNFNTEDLTQKIREVKEEVTEILSELDERG